MSMTRRKFEHLSVVLFPLTLGVSAVLAALRYLMPLPRRPRDKSVTIDEKAEYFTKPGAAPVKVEFNGATVFVVHDGKKIRAFDAKCTHLGCNVNWRSDNEDFFCPCHTASFARDGSVTAKPATTPLVEYAVAPIGDDGVVMVLDQKVQQA